jgi:hypothetical protein
MTRPLLVCVVVLAGIGRLDGLAADSLSSQAEAPAKPTAPTDLSQLRDITGIERTPSPPSEPSWSLWLWVGVAALPGLLLIGWKLGWRHAPEKPAPPPDRWALAELERIEALDLPAQGEVERFHSLVSDVLRRYLELRFHLPASQQTTPEFLQAVSAAGLFGAPEQQLLSAFLERCDLAKFARAGFSPEECRTVAQMARRLVEHTVGC